MLSDTIKSLTKKLLSYTFIDTVRLKIDRYLGYEQIIYSQFGEDLFLRDYFKDKLNGFYVDIGAYHPRQFSNTYFLYRYRGWAGINIEANLNCVTLFNQVRKRDVNIHAVVSDHETSVQYHAWGINSENSMNAAQINALTKRFGKAPEILELVAQPLSKLLNDHCPDHKTIDFLNIDVEGNDLAVLKSNNWNLYKPQIIAVEQFGNTIEQISKTDLYQYLIDKGYQNVAWYKPTLIFERKPK
ncbi:hypothetical protein Lepto7375DRAFT_1990 [Leptolyngbya sp. PCC 7375]|nr:hypothetical protein Lepto7375DRAFT_1990 [Leptolyngbya sp. PCC 7375]